MKKAFVYITVLFSTFLSAQKPIFTQAKITEAKVYTNGVELKHKTSATIVNGSSEIVITNVANYLNENTIQLSVPKFVTVMSVQFSNAYIEEYDNNLNSPLVKPVKDEISKKEIEFKTLQNQLQAERNSVELLDKNKSMSNAQNFSVAELTKLLEFYKTKRAELSNSINKLEEKEIVLNEDLNILRGKLSFNETTSEKTSQGKLILNVMSSQAAVIPIEVSYLSNSANWNPSYELRIDKINAPIQTVYKADVVQNTGIDWKNIKLSLTSGPANQNTFAPQLQPWFINYNENVQRYKSKTTVSNSLHGQVPGINVQSVNESTVKIRGVNSIDKNIAPMYIVDGIYVNEQDFKKINQDDIADVNILKDASATSLYGNRAANGVVVVTTKTNMGTSTIGDFTNVEESQLNVTYNLEIPYTVLSNNKKHSVNLKEMQIPASYQYVAVPKIDPSAYLIAKINDYAKYNLLPGEANVVFEGIYVGKTYIKANTEEEGLRLSLGKDANISVNKISIKDKSGTKILSSRKVQDYVYEISVRNNKKEAINIQIEDQIPISSNNDIEIAVTDKDGANLDSEKGKLTWDLNVKTNETKKVRFGYQIKSAKEKSLQ